MKRSIQGSVLVEAEQSTGVYSPNVLGNMFEWGHAYMNGAWAELTKNRNFEISRLGTMQTPLYDDFSSPFLDRLKWTPIAIGGPEGTVEIIDGHAVVQGTTGGRFGLLSNTISNTYSYINVESDMIDFTGETMMMSIYAGGIDSYSNFIEFGIVGETLRVNTDQLILWTGDIVQLPAKLRIEVGPLRGLFRNFKFFFNNQLVFTQNMIENIRDRIQVFLYGLGATTTEWNSLSIYTDNTYADFGGSAPPVNFTPIQINGDTSGTVFSFDEQVQITGSLNGRFGLISPYVKNSGVDWSEIEYKIDSITGLNALLSLCVGEQADGYNNFVEYGIENNRLVVYTQSGWGNWQGQEVTLPAVLKIQATPYYANGRDYKFFYNGEVVYEVRDIRDVPKGEFRIFMYGYSDSVTRWDYVKIHQEHFFERYSPHFEGTVLPVEWAGTVLEGSQFGTYEVNNSRLTIYGGTDSRYGFITSPIKDTDIKTFKVSAKLDELAGISALLHLKTGAARDDFFHFIEFGVQDGVLRIFTPTVSWTGEQVTLPVTLDIYVSPYSATGRRLLFVCDGKPVYVINDYEELQDEEFRIFLYGYGATTSVWDFCTYYPLEDWEVNNRDRFAVCESSFIPNTVSGSYAMKITAGDCEEISGISQSGIPIKAGNLYLVSLWVSRISGNQPIQIALGPAGAEDIIYTPYASETIDAFESEFIKYSIMLQPNTSDNNAKLIISSSSGAEFLIDQFSCMPQSNDEVLYGGWRKDFIEGLKELNPVSLRWPGGCLSDWYSWEDGIGERDRRPPLFFAQWDAECFNNDIGIDEFMDLCSIIGIHPVININYGSGTPEMAANWVEYCNGPTTSTYGALRQENGHPDPYNIALWEIGNETWGWWEPGATDAEQFARDYIEFRDAMYERDNSIRFLGEGGDGTVDSQEWNSILVSTVQDKIDQLAIHYYFPKELPQDYNDEEVYYVTVAAPTHIKAHLANVLNIIRDNTNLDIKIAVTEYNAMYFNSRTRRTAALEAALQTAGLLSVCLSDPGVTDSNFYSCLNNFWDGNAIRHRDLQAYHTPNYHVLSLFQNKRGEISLHSEVESPTYSSPALGNMPAIAEVPYLEVLATRNAQGDKAYISVLNKHLTDSVELFIQINGSATVGSEAIIFTIASDSPGDTNSFTEPDKVTITTDTISAGNTMSYVFKNASFNVIELDIAGLQPAADTVIIGRVVDIQDIPVVGATVTIDTGNSTITDNRGFYSIPVSQGRYSLTIQASGFDELVLGGVNVFSPLGTTAQKVVLRGDSIADKT